MEKKRNMDKIWVFQPSHSFLVHSPLPCLPQQQRFHRLINSRTKISSSQRRLIEDNVSSQAHTHLLVRHSRRFLRPPQSQISASADTTQRRRFWHQSSNPRYLQSFPKCNFQGTRISTLSDSTSNFLSIFVFLIPKLEMQVRAVIGSGFWTFVDMASGRYLWRHMVSSSKCSSWSVCSSRYL